MNVVAFVGTIVEIPILRESNAGNKFAVMDVEVKRAFPNSEGIYEYDVLSVTLWKGIAQTTAEVAKAGDLVAVKGRIQSHEYEANDGHKYRGYDLFAEHVTFLNQKVGSV